MEKLKYAIAITGGISTGKSTVCSLLKLYDYSVIDADKISHLMLDLMQDEIVGIFGKEILHDNKIDRKKLGLIVFNDKDKRRVLENILHPKIKEQILKEALELEAYREPYFIDIPLFFEASAKNKAYLIDKILLIYSSKDIQTERLMKRNDISKEEALKRIESQIDIELKKPLATYVVDNTKDLANLQKEIEIFLKNIKN